MNKTNSAFNWVEVEVEAGLGNIVYTVILIPHIHKFWYKMHEIIPILVYLHAKITFL